MTAQINTSFINNFDEDSNLDALRAATILPTEYFGMQETYGQIKEGMHADLILLNSNPLENIRNTRTIEAVVFNGNLYDRQYPDNIEKTVESQARSLSIACKILWEFLKNPVNY